MQKNKIKAFLTMRKSIWNPTTDQWTVFRWLFYLSNSLDCLKKTWNRISFPSKKWVIIYFHLAVFFFLRRLPFATIVSIQTRRLANARFYEWRTDSKRRLFASNARDSICFCCCCCWCFSFVLVRDIKTVTWIVCLFTPRSLVSFFFLPNWLFSHNKNVQFIWKKMIANCNRK